jgi:hypothetical protein
VVQNTYRADQRAGCGCIARTHDSKSASFGQTLHSLTFQKNISLIHWNGGSTYSLLLFSNNHKNIFIFVLEVITQMVWVLKTKEQEWQELKS